MSEHINNICPAGIDLREWQQNQCEAFTKKMEGAGGSGIFTVVAAPNSGKTFAAATNMAIARSQFGIEQFFYTSPNRLIRDQVIPDFEMFDIRLTSDVTNRKLLRFRLDPELDGVSCTYAMVSKIPDLYRKYCSDKPSMLVADEFHHLGSELTWGSAFKHAFEFCKIKMLMSGTAFRSDGNTLPFVEFEEGV